jgi:hypothetical protein
MKIRLIAFLASLFISTFLSTVYADDFRKIRIDSLEKVRLASIVFSDKSLEESLLIIQAVVEKSPKKTKSLGYFISMSPGSNTKSLTPFLTFDLKNPTHGQALAEISRQTKLTMTYQDFPDRFMIGFYENYNSP